MLIFQLTNELEFERRLNAEYLEKLADLEYTS